MSLNKAPVNNVFYRNQNWHYPKIVRGEGIYLYDDKGKQYIDGCSGSAVANIGHGNEEVARAAADQIKKVAFTHLSRFTAEPIEECARKVAEMTPGDLDHVYFVSGGSEATETCIKLARQYYKERDGKTSKWKVISRWTSYHGATMGALSMSGTIGRRKIYDPYLCDFPKINQAYCYRCPYKSKYPECGLACAYELEKEILKWGPENVAAFIAEPVIGSAAPGAHPPKEYFKIIRDICTKYDVLFIIDEVMMGFGRTGRNFGVDHYGVIPDLMACAKGMSCGYTPLGAAVANDEVFSTIMVKGSGQFIHGHTYGGNPLSCAIGSKVLDIIKRDNLVENAAVQGEYILNRMQGLCKYPIVGNVRGKGLMLGVEFVKDKDSKEPFDPSEKINSKVTVNCLEEGLVPYPGSGSVDGIRGDHILLAPPITITRQEADLFCDKLERAIAKTSEQILG
jgi:adenosylmethionine-8-amino-7-oxononanoate aminotransferase